MKLPELVIVEPGRVPYAKALEMQLALVERVKADPEGPGYLILLEHPRVITIGRSGSDGNIVMPRELLERRGFEVVESSRGGDVTYHGPGQIVGYPILSLRRYGKDIHHYMRTIEEALIQTAARWSIDTRRWPGRTGVWVGEDKLASIGVAVTRWVSYHGWALNANVDLGDFDAINPCGFTDIRMTSMERQLGEPVDMNEAYRALAECFCEVFEVGQARRETPEFETTD